MLDLSVIVCVYNTKPELFEKCLTSIYNSVFETFEVIIVDDGSSIDYSFLKQKFSQANWIKTKNEGTLNARLLGIKNAKGRFLCFVDSDDEVSFSYYAGMYACQRRTSADIVINDWAFKTENSVYYCGNDSTITDTFECERDAVLNKYFEKAGTEHSYYVLWNKIFRTSIMQKVAEKIENLNLVHFCFAEDVLISYFAFSLSIKLANVHLGYYFYRVHSEQQICVESKEKLLQHIISMSLVFELIKKDLNDIEKFQMVEKEYNDWVTLLSQNNFTVAKSKKYYDLFDEIKQRFHVENLSKMPASANKPYANHKLLPQNIEDIDGCLREVLKHNIMIVDGKKKSYAAREIKKINHLFSRNISVLKGTGNIKLPKEKQTIKNKIIHNDLFYKIGVLFFPKGSKIRKFLKNNL